MFLAYTLFRYKYGEAFAAASNHLDIRLGAINTVVLIVSSFTMAMAVFSTQVGKRRNSILFLIATLVLGLTFLGIKAVEYKSKYDDHLIPGRLIPSNPFNPVVAQHGDTDPHKLHMPKARQSTTSRCFYWIYSR
jgi:cytochrome c oxidase subunit 3